MSKHPQSKLAITRKDDGNPEGKGANGFLLDWAKCAPRGLVAKPRQQILAEFFTSMLVLSAKFKFRPAIGVTNYLYWVDGAWTLSLISPQEWSNEKYAAFAGSCVLQADMTWTIEPSEQLAKDSPMAEALGHFYDAFSKQLDNDQVIEDILPFYDGTVGYYQRLYASGLSRSIRATVELGDQASESCQQWRALLPRLKNILPNPVP